MKTKVTIYILVILLSFSFGYIFYNEYIKLKNDLLSKGYNKGVEESIVRIVDDTTNGECKAINLYYGDKKVDLINIECLEIVEQ